MLHAGDATPFTRGVGVYPGDPDEAFLPTFRIDATTYRNLALNRPATHSSAYDYNLTAQLVTDGIIHTTPPSWVSTWTSSDGYLPKPDREFLVGHFQPNAVSVPGSFGSVRVELGGGSQAPEVDHIAVFLAIPHSIDPAKVTLTFSSSEDGDTWTPIGSVSGVTPNTEAERWPPELTRAATILYPTIALVRPTRSRMYQLEFVDAGGDPGDTLTAWKFGQIEFYKGTKRVEVGGPYNFTSAWRSAGLDEEWVAVDLGAVCTIDKVALHWIARAAEGAVQISNDGMTWRTVRPLNATADGYKITPPTRARHVRVLMTRPTSPDGYILSELEVFGRGGPVVKAAQAAKTDSNGRLPLSGGAWRVQRESEVHAPGVALSQASFDDSTWLPATVPGTVLTSYLNAGAIPDPNFGQNQLYISDSFFYSDFWYRTTFTPAAAKSGQLRFLTFEGINWKAEVFLNRQSLGEIAGGFMRARFDVTTKLRAGENVLAVRVLKNATPGVCKQKTFESPSPNGGALGADNPTFHASVGWDWIPTIRGRNTGIWGEVALETTGPVTMENPGLISRLSNKNATADLMLMVDLVNHTGMTMNGILRGQLRFSENVPVETGEGQVKLAITPFEEPITLAPNTRSTVKFKPQVMQDPKLWWPVGYGEPNLYDVDVVFELADQTISHREAFKAGIREMTSTETGHTLKLFINGRRFIPKGGNWGFADSMLHYRAREYDVAVRYHREMNFNMIRNWVGQIPDDAFYEACDRHGIVVWQDFWLANPWDGPIPDDNAMFLANARDVIERIRHHASIGLYCGRNEWFPPAALDKGLRALLAELHPDIHYIGSSADDVVSGHGPYRALPPRTYFEHADKKFHSEIGMPNIPPIESIRAMMPEAAIWPQALDWGLHDFALGGAQGSVSFRSLVEENYGGATSGEEWVTLAQFLNYEGYRAIFEAQSRDRMGVLLWMSHSCWPSTVWQTYDYYFEPTAAYFGCKKACEPLHVQWNRYTGFVEVVNCSAGSLIGLTAQVEILNLDGSVKATQTAQLDSADDSNSPCIKIAYPTGLTPVHFLRLTLSGASKVHSTNLYLRGVEEGNLRAIRSLPKVRVEAKTTVSRQGGSWLLTTELHNSTANPALMVRLKAVRAVAGDRILPAIYSDNYVTLMPNESRTVTTALNHVDTRGQVPRIVLSGFNVLGDTGGNRGRL